MSKNAITKSLTRPHFLPIYFPGKLHTDIVYEDHISFGDTNTTNIHSFAVATQNIMDPVGGAAFESAQVPLLRTLYTNFRVLYTNISFSLRPMEGMREQIATALNNVTTFASAVRPGEHHEKQWLVTIPQDSATPLTDYDAIFHHPHAKRWVIPAESTGRTLHGSVRISGKQWWTSGYNSLNASLDAQFAWKDPTPFTVATNTANPIFLLFYILSWDSTNVANVIMGARGRLKIVQRTEFTLPKLTDYGISTVPT